MNLGIGESPFSREAIISELETFATLYKKRPILDNPYGMKSPHLFATWFILRQLNPKIIVESGIYKGLGTWIMESACPNAELHCIDINLSIREYQSRRARYYDKDFTKLNWDALDRGKTLLFFDDHQDAVQRLKDIQRLGFKHAIFEDNYPEGQGDCYSLKKAMTRPHDLALLQTSLSTYWEFPPVFQTNETRWRDEWKEPKYPTAKPLLNRVEKPYQQIFLDEAQSYTWICYIVIR